MARMFGGSQQLIKRILHLRRSVFTKTGCAAVLVVGFLAFSILASTLMQVYFGLRWRPWTYLDLPSAIRLDSRLNASSTSSGIQHPPETSSKIQHPPETSSGIQYPPETREERRILDLLEVGIKSGCPKSRKPTDSQVRFRHQVWQVQEDDDDEVVVYSAFYDDRSVVGYLPWIRILGVRRLSGNSETPLFCYVWFDEFEAPLVTQVEVTVTGRDHDVMEHRKYGQRLYSCPLPASHPIPTHVSVATRKCDPSTILLPVYRPLRAAEWQHEFGICIESSFGSFPVELISEWIEAYLLFGVTQINIYNASLNSSLDRIIDRYVQKGIVNLRQLPPSVDDYSEEGIRLSSPTSLNDCMMRNMYSNRFMVVVDYDEIIVPRNHSKYSEMIASVDAVLGRAESHHTYSFRNTYFFLFFPEDVSQPEYLRTMRIRYRTPPSDFLYGSKSFVDPRRCLSVFNHYCWVNFPGEEDKGPVDVPGSLGLSHHYRRSCSQSPKECHSYDENKVVDDTMLRFKSTLESRVSTALKAISREI